jgi:FemAB-related protein (PEP-CTERM system-associated)
MRAEPHPLSLNPVFPALQNVRVEHAPDDDPRWDPYVASRPEGTFFHRAGWSRAFARIFGYRWRGMIALRGARVVGLLPLSQVRGFPRGTSLISSPFASYGGVLADDAEAGAALLEAASELASEIGARYLELRDGMRFPELPVKDLYVTFRRPIGPDHEQNFAAIRNKQRTSIRNAQKHGLTDFTGGAELLSVLYPIYSHSVRNLGTPVFPRRLFQELLEEFPRDSRILVAERDGKAVSAVLAFFHAGHVLPHYAGTLHEAYRYSGSDYMYWSLMRVAADRGSTVYDFGRSKRETGAFEFKKHWGLEPTPLAYQYLLLRDKTIPDLSPKNPRFSLAIRAWRRLPLPVAERIGPRVVRFFP